MMAKITCRLIAASVAEYFGTTLLELRSARRPRRMTLPRRCYFWLARQLTDKSLPVIARALGGRDHTTMHHGLKEIERMIGEDPSIRKLLDELETIIRAAAEAMARLGLEGADDIDAVEVAARVLNEPLARARVSTDELRVMAETILSMNEALTGSAASAGFEQHFNGL